MWTGVIDMQRKLCLLGVLYGFLLIPGLLHAEPVQVVEETTRSISFRVDVPEPVFVPSGDGYGSVCSVEGFSLYPESGMPGVVQRGVMAAIPRGARVGITIAVHATQDFKNIDLAPVPTFAAD